MKILLTTSFLFLITSCSSSSYKGPVTDHFNGKVFVNQVPFTHRGIGDIMKWFFSQNKKKWPKWIEEPPQKIAKERNNKGELSVTFINHATTLIQVDGFNILTDPIYSERCSPFSWIGPKRVRNPGVLFEDLPPIDVVLIGHNHYDHLDLSTLKKIKERDNPLFLTGLGNGNLLKGEDILSYEELDWWQTTSFKDLSITFTPTQHFSGRGLFDRMETLWGSFVIQSSHGGGNIYFSSDTGMGPHFKEIGKRFGPFRLSLLPIGAYEPRWFMKEAHVNPEEALMAHKDLQSRQSVAIHFGTFQLTDEGIDDPIKDLHQSLQKTNTPLEKFRVLKFGETLFL